MNENHDDEDLSKELRRSRFHHSLSIEEICSLLDEHIFNSETPIVVALDGLWGEGKTYFWKRVILPKYSTANSVYVSVFGSSTIQGIRERVIFEVLRSPKWFNNSLVKSSAAIGRGLVNRIPKIGPILTTAMSRIRTHWPELFRAFVIPAGVSVHLFEEEFLSPGVIICLDDIERVSDEVGIDHLLGYINELKEERKLKVVLIYNHEKLDDKEGLFQKLQEKVIDKRIAFAPKINELLKIVFPSEKDREIDDGLMEELARRCHVLEMRNIRLLQKVKSYYRQCANTLDTPIEKKFQQELLFSLLLFVWVKYCPKDAGPITFDFLTKLSSFVDIYSRTEGDSDPEANQRDFLREYGYSYTSELDLVLMQLVESDILNIDKLDQEYKNFIKDASEVQMRDALTDVWKKYYHGTLRDTKKDFCDALVEAIKKYIEIIPLNNFDEALCALRDLGQKEKADALLALFLEKRGGFLKEFNRRQLIEPPKYPELNEILTRIERENKADNRGLDEVIKSALKDEYPSTKDRQRLSEFTAKDYIDYFTSNDQEHLTSTMRELAGFATKITNPDEAAITLRNTILQAAEEIAATNDINLRRMQSMNLVKQKKRDQQSDTEQGDEE